MSVLKSKSVTLDHRLDETEVIDEKPMYWWKQRHEETLKRHKENNNFQLVVFGDSITHFWETTGKKFWDSEFSKLHTTNLGYSGDRTEHALWRIENGELDGLNPKLLILLIGTNNTGHRNDSPEDTSEGILKIISSIKMKCPKTKILLLSIFPRSINPIDPLRQSNDAINKLISSYDNQENVFFRDYNSVFLKEHSKLNTDLLPDELHPNEQGYEVWFKTMIKDIKDLM